MKIPFNDPFITGNEIEYINEVLVNKHLCGDGRYSKLCHEWLEATIGCAKALLTPSGTAALEMAALLLDIGAGDEVIMPSFTFVSTANAFVLRGATVVFVDICADTLNIDPALIARAITKKTRAVVPVHYAGVGCDMHAISDICRDSGVAIVEDAAHAILSDFDGKPLGSFGAMGCLSFHETKNLVAGEAGALLINDPELVRRAEIIREKGTNRSQFFRGHVDKYSWQDLGSSYLPSELQAAFLWAQMEQAKSITQRRQESWNRYFRCLKPLELAGLIRLPVVPAPAMQNGHLFYILLENQAVRDELLAYLTALEIGSVFHYIPLHDAPGAKECSRVVGDLSNTTDLSGRLLRLPLSVNLTEREIEFVVESIYGFFGLNLTHDFVSGEKTRVTRGKA